MSARRLTGRVVVITGAGRGLGRALAEAFSADGASLVLGARTAPEIDELASRLGNAIAVTTDVRNADECARLIDTAVAEFGRLDILVNNAGLAIYGPLESMEPADIDVMVDTNVKGLLYLSTAALRVMKPARQGHIVQISSIAGRMHLVNESVYSATKWAVNGFSEILRREAAPFGVKVTTVCPGGIATPFWAGQEYLPFPDHIDPQRDFMRPEEVAAAVLEAVHRSAFCNVPELVMVPMVPDGPGQRSE